MLTFQNALRATLRWFLIVLVASLLAIMSAQIVWRYGFNSSLLWSEELCRYILIWVSFLAAVLAFERGEVAALSFLASALPRVPSIWVAMIVSVLSGALCFTLAWYGYVYAKLAGGQPIPALSFIVEDLTGQATANVPSVFWVYASLPIGMALLGCRGICLIWLRHARDWATPT